MKILSLLVVVFLLAVDAQAQVTGGGLIMCENPSGNKRVVACDANGVVGPGASSVEATFPALDVTLPGGIGAAYTTVQDLPDGTKSVLFDNQTNGSVIVSMDGGATDHYDVAAGTSITLPLAQIGLVTSAVIAIKDGTVVATTGSFNITGIK